MNRISPLLSAFLIAFIVLILASNNTAEPSELEGEWQNIRQIGSVAVFISFGADGSFYCENNTDWYSGSYELAEKGETAHVILFVEDGSDPEICGELCIYPYELKAEALVLDTSQNPGLWESQSDTGRGVFIAIHYDSDEDDDDEEEFSIYATCFLSTAAPDVYQISN